MFNSPKVEGVMRRILERGIATGGEYKFKHHSKYPNAPLAPFKFNLCTEATRRDGKLLDEDIDAIAELMRDFLVTRPHHQNIAGIPNAGHVIAERIQRIKPGSRLLQFSKIGEGDTRRIGPLVEDDDCPLNSRIWGIDDLSTYAGSKCEFIEMVSLAKFSIRDILVLMNYGFGADTTIEHRYGVRLEWVFSVDELFDFAERENERLPTPVLDPRIIETGRNFLHTMRTHPLDEAA